MAITIAEDTRLGRDTIRNAFAWALGGMDEILKPGESYTMTLKKHTSNGRRMVTLQYLKEVARP